MIPGWFWLLWVILGAVSFAVAEGVALVNRRSGDTLSENTRRWFHVTTKAGRYVWVIIWGLFAMWFGVHIAMDGSV